MFYPRMFSMRGPRSQTSITLRSLETLAGPGVRYSDLRQAVAQAAIANLTG